MKTLEFNQMELLIGGVWWDSWAWGSVCGIVGLVAAVGTANPFVGAGVTFVCNGIGAIAKEYK